MKLRLSIMITVGLLFVQSPPLSIDATFNLWIHDSMPMDATVDESIEVMMMPDDSTHQVYEGLWLKKTVFGFYQSRKRAAFWATAGGLTPLGDSMIGFITNLRYYGLHSEDYRLDELVYAKRQGYFQRIVPSEE